MARKNAGSTRSPVLREIRNANPSPDFPGPERHEGPEHGQDPSDERPTSSLYDVFISYAEADRARVEAFGALAELAGEDVVLARKSSEPEGRCRVDV